MLTCEDAGTESGLNRELEGGRMGGERLRGGGLLLGVQPSVAAGDTH